MSFMSNPWKLESMKLSYFTVLTTIITTNYELFANN
jgi:hypothetical protein